MLRKTIISFGAVGVLLASAGSAGAVTHSQSCTGGSATSTVTAVYYGPGYSGYELTAVELKATIYPIASFSDYVTGTSYNGIGGAAGLDFTYHPNITVTSGDVLHQGVTYSGGKSCSFVFAVL